MNDRRFVYTGKPFDRPDIYPLTYRDEFFQAQIELESDVFYDLRKAHGILPFRLSDSTEQELREIRDFFRKNASSFFFLFDGSRLVGSILLLGNYIQSLAVARGYRRRGCGELLSKYAVNAAFDTGYDRLELDVLEGNTAAMSLYEKIGFRNTAAS